MTGSVTDSQAMSISYRYRENYHQVNAPTAIVTLDIDVLRTSRLKKRIVLGYVPVSENGWDRRGPPPAQRRTQASSPAC
jgi:hypothetical protein